MLHHATHATRLGEVGKVPDADVFSQYVRRGYLVVFLLNLAGVDCKPVIRLN